MLLHVKCRGLYASGEKRFEVPDDKVYWDIPFPEYEPVDFTHAVVVRQPIWADPEVRVLKDIGIRFNAIDGNIDRTSHEGPYQIAGGVPRNPRGRTGMVGRGLLGKWGPNHAADPIVTRWKRDESGVIIVSQEDGKPVLEFVGIKRKDPNNDSEWAIPGGMVDNGETVTATLKREFGEEALNSTEKTEEEKKVLEEQVSQLFRHGVEIYKGYVDDPRNTDNAWMETVAFNFHDESGDVFCNFLLEAGDDAGAVRWMEVTRDLRLYASHIHFIEQVVNLRGAHW